MSGGEREMSSTGKEGRHIATIFWPTPAPYCLRISFAFKIVGVIHPVKRIKKGAIELESTVKI